MNKFLFSAFLFISLIGQSVAHAHGDGKPGPHGGQIRMPGPYHTEAVISNNGFQVFLLDINFENPTTENSEVIAILNQNGRSSTLKCTANADHFYCGPVEDLDSGTLTINSKRGLAKGNAANYELPFL